MKKITQEPSDMAGLPGATVFEDEIETVDEAVVDPEDDAVEDVDPEDDTASLDEEDEPEAVETPAEAPKELSEEDKDRAAYERMVAKGIIAPAQPQQQTATQAVDDDPEPERYDEYGSEDAYFAWRDRQIEKRIMAQMAPAMAPMLQSQAIARVRSEIVELGLELTPDMEAMILNDAQKTSTDDLRAIMGAPGLATNIAAGYVKRFRTNAPAPNQASQKATPAQVVVKGVASAPAGGSKVAEAQVSIPNEFKGHYERHIRDFKLKNTNATRKEYLEQLGLRG
jgi:hypothetical protein